MGQYVLITPPEWEDVQKAKKKIQSLAITGDGVESRVSPTSMLVHIRQRRENGPPLSQGDRVPSMGIVACSGPASEADFSDNRYWVQQATPSIVSGRIQWTAVANGWHVAAENLFECNTHLIDPQTPVSVHFAKDASGNSVNFFLVGAEGCGGTCPESSSSGSSGSSSDSSGSSGSSGSSSDTSLCGWYVDWNCGTETWGTVQYYGTATQVDFATWSRRDYYGAAAEGSCRYIIQGPCGSTPSAPTEPPTDCEACGSSSSGSSGDAICGYYVDWNCGTSTWGTVNSYGSASQIDYATWTRRDYYGTAAAGSCRYIIQALCSSPPSAPTEAPTDCESCLPSSSGSSSTEPPPSSSGSDKSTAIVPASWSRTRYAALFTLEAPEVRFDDVVEGEITQKNQSLAIDFRYAEVCEPGTLRVCGASSNLPVAIGAEIDGLKLKLRFARPAKRKLKIVLRLTGIRKGFLGMRFPERTRNQFVHNERFINSAYPRK